MPASAVASSGSARELPTRRDGAKALLLTVLGEFVLPAGGAAWTSSLVAAAGSCGVGEKNARQAIARIADQGIITSARHGRTVRWSLTPAGRTLLEAGTERIYSFGCATDRWDGQWLIAHCQVAESQRNQRDRLRTQLKFLGFGELSPSLFVSPHLGREQRLREVLSDLELLEATVLMRSEMLSDNAAIVGAAWDLVGLDGTYRGFVTEHGAAKATDGGSAFAATVALVHDWRHFPSVDPELPAELMPNEWVGATAAQLFVDRHSAWSPPARAWFEEIESVTQHG